MADTRSAASSRRASFAGLVAGLAEGIVVIAPIPAGLSMVELVLT